MKSKLLLTALTAGLFAAMAAWAADVPAINSSDTNAAVTNADAAEPAEATPADATPQPPDETTSPSAIISTPPAASTEISNTPLFYQWFKNSNSITGATNSQYTVPSAAATTTTTTTTTAQPVVAFVPPVQSTMPATVYTNGEKGLRLNFRGVPLEAVLNYLSDAAGFIIHPKVDVRGKVDVWSNQALTKDEAVKLLKQILNENGYTVLQDGRELTIISNSEARSSAIPVFKGSLPDAIPKNSDIVTQVIPVRSLNVVELVKTLQPLMPSGSTLSADESANSLVMTDTQANIHRIVEIISALDSVTSSAATIRVFQLRYADSKSLAGLIKDLFSPTDTASTRGGGFGGFGRFFRGGGGGGGFPGGGGNEESENGHTPTAKVTAVSDDHSNSLIVSAPDSLINDIAGLVNSVDNPVEDTTEIEVFHLHNADPTEMAEVISTLFPSDTTSTDATRQPFRFGFGFPGAQQNTAGSKSERVTKMSSVTAVADRRTASLIVTAGKDLMPGISNMVTSLDARTDRKQTPHVIPLANADPVEMQQILQDLFPSSNSNGRSSTSSSGGVGSSSTSDPLGNRATTLLQQQNSTSSSGFGGVGSTGTSGRGF